MRSDKLLTRLGPLFLCVLLLAGSFLLGPATAPAGAISPANHLVAWIERLPREAIINGHCALVDDNGVPLTDSLSYQRTGHDPC